MDERQRILAEMHRRAAQIPRDFYALDRPVNHFLHRRYARAARELLRESGFENLKHVRALEVGCGDAKWLIDLLRWGASGRNLHAIDLDGEHISTARKRLGGVDLQVGDASDLPWPNATFDLIVQSTMFTSILSAEMRAGVAREMIRALKPGGVILWYDFVYDNPRNANVKGIPIPKIRELFPGFEMSYRRVTLAPPIARVVVPISERIAAMLAALPFLRTHVIATLRKPNA